jgi:hypothetical protein
VEPNGEVRAGFSDEAGWVLGLLPNSEAGQEIRTVKPNGEVRGSAATGGLSLAFSEKKAIQDRKRRFQQMLVASCIAASACALALVPLHEIAPPYGSERVRVALVCCTRLPSPLPPAICCIVIGFLGFLLPVFL